MPQEARDLQSALLSLLDGAAGGALLLGAPVGLYLAAHGPPLDRRGAGSGRRLGSIN